MEIQTTPYFLVLLERSKHYDSLDKFTDEHFAFIDEFVASDKIFIGGELDTSSKKNKLIFNNIDSAYLLNVRTMNEASRIAKKDPFTINNVYNPIVVQWNLIEE